MWIAGYVHRPDQVEFFPLARFWGDELRRPIVVVCDQSGIGRGYFDETAYADLTRRMCTRFEAGTDRPRVPFPYCPLHATGEYRRDHPRSKPNPGMIFQAVSDLELDHRQCADEHIEAGTAAGLGLDPARSASRRAGGGSALA